MTTSTSYNCPGMILPETREADHHFGTLLGIPGHVVILQHYNGADGGGCEVFSGMKRPYKFPTVFRKLRH